MTVLSTKILSSSQQQLLLNAGLGLVQYNAIDIVPLDFEWPTDFQNFVFSSSNAARIVLAKEEARAAILNPENKIFCVGEKTAQIFVENGGNVIEIGQNSGELGQKLQKYPQKERYLYCCGIARRDELPGLLKAAKYDVFELKTYETKLKLKEFDQKWTEILFFSPSAVTSYTTANPSAQFRAFCIGQTTATEAKKYTDRVVVANSTSVESVIAKTAKTLLYDQERSIS